MCKKCLWFLQKVCETGRRGDSLPGRETSEWENGSNRCYYSNGKQNLELHTEFQYRRNCHLQGHGEKDAPCAERDSFSEKYTGILGMIMKIL